MKKVLFIVSFLIGCASPPSVVVSHVKQSSPGLEKRQQQIEELKNQKDVIQFRLLKTEEMAERDNLMRREALIDAKLVALSCN